MIQCQIKVGLKDLEFQIQKNEKEMITKRGSLLECGLLNESVREFKEVSNF